MQKEDLKSKFFFRPFMHITSDFLKDLWISNNPISVRTKKNGNIAELVDSLM